MRFEIDNFLYHYYFLEFVVLQAFFPEYKHLFLFTQQEPRPGHQFRLPGAGPHVPDLPAGLPKVHDQTGHPPPGRPTDRTAQGTSAEEKFTALKYATFATLWPAHQTIKPKQSQSEIAPYVLLVVQPSQISLFATFTAILWNKNINPPIFLPIVPNFPSFLISFFLCCQKVCPPVFADLFEQSLHFNRTLVAIIGLYRKIE